MTPNTPRVRMPNQAHLGEIIAIKTKIRHPMETGWREDHTGKTVPRNRITRFSCEFDDTEIFSADLYSGVAADPYLLFHTRVLGSGTYVFRWEADDGQIFTATAPMLTTGV